jgi:hypothetical protein
MQRLVLLQLSRILSWSMIAPNYPAALASFKAAEIMTFLFRETQMLKWAGCCPIVGVHSRKEE